MVAIMPDSINFLTTSPAFTPIALASSPTEMTSEMRTMRLLALGMVISVCFCSLPGSARFLRGRRAWRFSRSLISANSGFWITRRFFFLPAPPRSSVGGGFGSAGASVVARGRRPRAASTGVGRARAATGRPRPSSDRCAPAPSGRTDDPVTFPAPSAPLQRGAAARRSRRPAPVRSTGGGGAAFSTAGASARTSSTTGSSGASSGMRRQRGRDLESAPASARGHRTAPANPPVRRSARAARGGQHPTRTERRRGGG